MQNFNSGVSVDDKPVNFQLVSKMLFFQELVRAGTITFASERVGISKSTGSRWLSELEQELGVTLYQRAHSQKRLTEAGVYLYESLTDVSSDLREIIQRTSQYSTQVVGHMSVCCMPIPIYADQLVLSIVNEFVQLNPNVDIQMLVTPRAFDFHQTQDFIITSSAGDSIDADESKQFETTTLLQDNFITVASPKYLREHGEPLVPSDLSLHRCLHCKSLVGQNEWVYMSKGRSIPVKTTQNLELSDINMLLKAAINSIGISYLPKMFVKKEIEDGSLVAILDEYDTESWYLNFLSRAVTDSSRCNREFKSFFLKMHKEKLKAIF